MMGIPLLHGRDFGPGDQVGKPKAVVIDERLAARFFSRDGMRSANGSTTTRAADDPTGKKRAAGDGDRRRGPCAQQRARRLAHRRNPPADVPLRRAIN